MLNKEQKQEQTVETGGIAVQAGNNIIINSGLSYDDARKIALDVFISNFYVLQGIAKELARARGEEITEKFLSKLQNEYKVGLNKSQDPDFQYALFTVQKEYARSGDKDLGDLLVDLLVDRCKQEQRDILQIVLNESLNTAPKLTEAQMAILSIVFLFRYTQHNHAGSHELFGDYLDKHVAPFASKLVKNDANYQHLEFAGCGAIQIGERSLEGLLGAIYQGLFLKGFEPKEITERGITCGLDNRIFIQCLNNPLKLQVNAINKAHLSNSFETHAIHVEDRAKISALFDFEKMNNVEIKEKCIGIRPYMSSIFDCWSGSPIKSFSLTSVGIAIGHANIKRLISKEFANLAFWIY